MWGGTFGFASNVLLATREDVTRGVFFSFSYSLDVESSCDLWIVESVCIVYGKLLFYTGPRSFLISAICAFCLVQDLGVVLQTADSRLHLDCTSIPRAVERVQ